MASQEKRNYTVDDYYNLPNFIQVEVFNGVIYPRQDYVTLEIDDDVFTENHQETIQLPIEYPL